ncbi:MAG: zinc ribbon domain-containing protein [Gemmatimonadota bacterium]
MPAPLTCPNCGAESATGNFCPGCGAPLGQRTCTACSASLSAGARFCHRCGHPAAGVIRREAERRAWMVAGGLAVLLVLVIMWFMVRGAKPAAAPDMANVGSTAGATDRGLGSGQPPDISKMTPEERFTRLFERVTSAAETGDSAQVAAFVPMALGAYAQLPGITNDDRFHAAMLYFMTGDFPGALALADTIQGTVPHHLFAPLIRGTVAEAQGDKTGLARNFAVFVENYAAEQQAGRQEYSDHRELLEQFKHSADSAFSDK